MSQSGEAREASLTEAAIDYAVGLIGVMALLQITSLLNRTLCQARSANRKCK